jgi:hypothetical protein
MHIYKKIILKFVLASVWCIVRTIILSNNIYISLQEICTYIYHYKKFAYLRQHQVDAKSPKVDANKY